MEYAPDRNQPLPAPTLPEMSEEDKDIVHQAQTRFDRCVTWESKYRSKGLEDLKFYWGDSYNGWQWPQSTKNDRDIAAKPSLTINKTRQHCLQIENDSKQNRSSVKVHPVGGAINQRSCKIMDGLIKRIEYQSNAASAYDNATEFQVRAGRGYVRVATDYAGDDTTNKEIFIRRVEDPFSVYLDPSSVEMDGTDARYAFIYEALSPELFRDMYPQFGHYANQSPLKTNTFGWITVETIKVVEYFWLSEREDQLFTWRDEDTGEVRVVKGSKMSKELRAKVIDTPGHSQRALVDTQVNWALIAGDRVVEKQTWPGRFIPLVPMYGQRNMMNGQLDCVGHVRFLMDAQRMYNYWSSAAVEFGALQSKTPYIAPAAAIEGHETLWDTANTQNHSVLLYNHMDDEGNDSIPPPKRQEPPMAAPVALEGMKTAMMELQLASGQHEAQMGQPGNERSGKAIRERQRQGDNATYHFIDNQATMIRGVGKILVDLIPRIYDTPRVMHILGDDGKPQTIHVDPDHPMAHEAVMGDDGKVAHTIFNPLIGKYGIQVDVGPSFATQREEAVDALTAIMTQAPQTTSIIGDIMIRACDFPMADEAADRLKRMVPPQALGEGPTPQEQQLQQQNQQMQAAIQHLSEELGKLEDQIKNKDLLREVDVYKALTERLKVTGGAMAPAVAVDAIKDALGIDLTPYLHLMQEQSVGSFQGPHPAVAQTPMQGQGQTASQLPQQSQGQVPEAAGPPTAASAPASGPEEEPPVPGSRKAPDGEWYLPDSTRPGKFLRVVRNVGRGSAK